MKTPFETQSKQVRHPLQKKELDAAWKAALRKWRLRGENARRRKGKNPRALHKTQGALGYNLLTPLSRLEREGALGYQHEHAARLQKSARNIEDAAFAC